MNFDNLAVSEDFIHSKAKRAVDYSSKAEFSGNNFMAVYNEKD